MSAITKPNFNEIMDLLLDAQCALESAADDMRRDNADGNLTDLITRALDRAADAREQRLALAAWLVMQS